MDYEEEKTMEELQEQVRELKYLIMDLKHIIQFHELDRIPRRYMRAFAKKGEYPFIALKESAKKEVPSIFELGFPTDENPLQDLNFPKDPEEFKKAQERMHIEYQYGKNAKNFNDMIDSIPQARERMDEMIKRKLSHEEQIRLMVKHSREREEKIRRLTSEE